MATYLIEIAIAFTIPVGLLIARAAIDHYTIKELCDDVKKLKDDGDSCKLSMQRKIDSAGAYDKFVSQSVYLEGMKNLEERMLKEMEHLNKTMDNIFQFMKKEN